MAGAPRRRELIPYLALLATLIVTAAAGRYAYVTGANEDQLRFVNAADTVCTAIVDRLDAYVAMLLGGAGLFAASEDITREDFADYVERLEVGRRYPGVRGIGFSRRIGPDERQSVLDFIRRDLPDFGFWPESPEGDINAILYLEPDDEMNRRALGYDMGSETNRAAAMARARDSGAPAASGKVRLVQEGGDNPDPQVGLPDLRARLSRRHGARLGGAAPPRPPGLRLQPVSRRRPAAEDRGQPRAERRRLRSVRRRGVRGVADASIRAGNRRPPFPARTHPYDRGPPVDGPPVRGRLDA